MGNRCKNNRLPITDYDYIIVFLIVIELKFNDLFVIVIVIENLKMYDYNRLRNRKNTCITKRRENDEKRRRMWFS